MLESLCRGAGTIHELNLDGAFPARMRYRPREIYEGLKATELFDAERGQWNRHGDQSLHRTSRDAYVQLLGVLVEAQFNLTGARALYAELKSTTLYDAAWEQWNWHMSDCSIELDTDRHSSAQLLGVLVEAQFNPERARALYEKLKGTPLYDTELRQWNWYMLEEQVRPAMRCAPDYQLLGVLVEAKLLSTLARPLAEAVPPLPVTEAW